MLGLFSPDPILSVVGPVGLAASRGTALVVDLASEVRAGRTLKAMAEDGPTRAELSPGRSGIAMIRGGGVDNQTAQELISELAGRWPALVVRVSDFEWPLPMVTAIPLYPGHLLPPPRVSHCVWQPVGTGATPPGPGPVLPRLAGGTIRRILSGGLPRSSRWVKAWAPIWEMPWA